MDLLDLIIVLGIGFCCISFIGIIWISSYIIRETIRQKKFNALVKQGKAKEAWEYWDSVNLK
jgi:hypothetical protein